MFYSQDSVYVMMPTPWDKSLDLVDQFTGWTPKKFYDIFYNSFGEAPSYHAPSAFSNGLMLMAAIEKTQSLDPLTVANAIRSMNFQTLYRNMSFAENNQANIDFLVVQMQYDLTYRLVLPSAETNASVTYPMPTWASKECEISTVYCSGHGKCNEAGHCICDTQYYGKVNPQSCDTYCDGVIGYDAEDSDFCMLNTTYYIGGMVNYATTAYFEVEAMINLAINLVNNKTDGWFDNTPQV